MADSGRSAGGVAPSSFSGRFRPSRIAPYDRPGLHRSTPHGPPATGRSTQYGPPAIGPSNYSPLLRPAMDLSKVPPCLHYLYPYGPPFSLLAALPDTNLDDYLPANLRRSAPCDPPAIGCNSTPPGSKTTKAYSGHECSFCGGKVPNNTVVCPFLILAAQLDVVKDKPPIEWKFNLYVVRNEREGMDGYGVEYYVPPKEGDVERSAADAMKLYKDGLNLIRITCLPENNKDPERLCRQLGKKFGPVAHATVFPDQSFGFVKFVSRDSAEKAIEVLDKNSDCGYAMWAMQIPD